MPQLSPPIRIAALVGILAVLAMGAGFFVLGGGGGSTSDAAVLPTIKPLYGGKKVGAAGTKKAAAEKTVAKKAPAKTAKSKVAKPETKATPAKAAVEPAPKPKPNAHALAARKAGLPAVVADALGEHAVVVVTIGSARDGIDDMLAAEARSGARLAGAGFVAVDSSNDRVAGALAKKLGLLPDPAILVFKRPGELALRFDTFVDHETVAQAARNVS